MKHLNQLLKIIRIHPLTYFYVVLSFVTGYWKYYLSAYLIVCIHELCHFMMAYFFRFEIDKIDLLPFGAYLSLKDFGLKPKIYELCVLLAGPCCHLIIYIFLSTLQPYLYVQYLLEMNYLIFIFNLLPIYPMDGYRVLLIFIQGFIDLQKSHYIGFKISVFCLCVFMSYCRVINNWIIFVFLLYYHIDYYKNIPFFIRRYFLNIPYLYKNKKIKIHSRLKYLRDCHNYYKINNEFYDEEQVKFELIKMVKRIEK